MALPHSAPATSAEMALGVLGKIYSKCGLLANFALIRHRRNSGARDDPAAWLALSQVLATASPGSMRLDASLLNAIGDAFVSVCATKVHLANSFPQETMQPGMPAVAQVFFQLFSQFSLTFRPTFEVYSAFV